MAGVHAMMVGSGGGGGDLYLKPNGVTVAAASESAKGKWHKLGGKNYYVAEDYYDLSNIVSFYGGLSGDGEVLANLDRDDQTFSIPLNQVVTTYIDKLGTDIEDGLFLNLASFNQLINSWDVSNVTMMNYLFIGCTSYNQPLNYWDTSSCTDMDYMFYVCYSFEQDISSWCVYEIRYKPEGFDDYTLPAWNDAMKPNWGAAC